MYLGQGGKLLDLRKEGFTLSVVENMQYSIYGVRNFYILTSYHLTP